MAAQGSYIKPIIIGVATTVLTAVVLKYLNLDGDNSQPGQQKVQASSEETAALLKRQEELEARLAQLSQAEIKQKQKALEEQVTLAEQRHRETRQHSQSIRAVNINGTWRYPQTGSIYKIKQDGNFFTLQEMSALGVVSAAGEGTLKGLKGTFNYNTMFGTTGSGTIRLSSDNSTMNVGFTDHVSQMTMNIALVR